MKKSIEQYGKTVEEAIRKGLEELKVSREDVIVTVLDEPTTGMLGMLSSKMAKVRLVVEKKIDSEVINQTIEKAKEIISNIFNILKENANYTVDADDNKIIIKIESEDSAHLIGYKGKTIEALQSTLNSILQKEETEYAKVYIEVNNYKEKKEEKLKALARRLANNVIRYKKDIRMEPMSGYERMIIHTELANSNDVITESIGEEPRRCVIIKKTRK